MNCHSEPVEESVVLIVTKTSPYKFDTSNSLDVTDVKQRPKTRVTF